MKKLFLILCAACAACACAPTAPQPEKRLYMWFDCEANFALANDPDSIRHYLGKCREAGFTDAVVDVKSIMGETVYPSAYAPFMHEWDGVERPETYDVLDHFIRIGHELGMRVYGSLNIFAGGHNYFDRGIIYDDHADWQSQVSTPEGIVPISTIKTNYNGMLNPADPEVRKYELDILREFAERYPEVDGVIFDRLRYDDITSDFSPLSKQLFETYIGAEVTRFPEDILYWQQNEAGEWKWQQGPLFRKWIEWRAGVIKSFVEESHAALKAINPDLRIGDYTGAWYPTYYYVGVNWASTQFDPAEYFDWATPEYRNTGYAELLDVYMTGLYYTLVTKDEVDRANGTVGRRTEAGMTDEQSYWYCVECGAEWARRLTCGAAPLIGSLYVEQYDGDAEQFGRAVAEALRQTDGLMIFDVMHIIKRDWWQPLAEGIAAAETSK